MRNMDIKLNTIEFENILESENEIENFIESMYTLNHSISQSVWILYYKRAYSINSFSDLLHRVYERKTLQKFVKQEQKIKIGKIFEENSFAIQQAIKNMAYLEELDELFEDFRVMEKSIRLVGHRRVVNVSITAKRIRKMIRKYSLKQYLEERNLCYEDFYHEELQDLSDYWTRMDIDPELVYVPWDSIYLII